MRFITNWTDVAVLFIVVCYETYTLFCFSSNPSPLKIHYNSLSSPPSFLLSPFLYYSLAYICINHWHSNFWYKLIYNTAILRIFFYRDCTCFTTINRISYVHASPFNSRFWLNAQSLTSRAQSCPDSLFIYEYQQHLCFSAIYTIWNLNRTYTVYICM